MTTNTTRVHGAHRAERSPRERVSHDRRRHPSTYPNDYLHSDRPYEESQRDIGGGLFLGAITLIALMALIVTGLLF
ncbi:MULTISPECIES: hypothetical protein [unclassified Phycicoccus]|uniref:hypothetical protein n=1 Tax=unclassified Phycicoccus TaxID=2637926 RepID=UPI00070313AD|nr:MULTISPECIES: hypothetical protein [unclassified Phycicoccus]KQU65244.1 hypothetical protein ASC58_17225 [Phycicoccus sp. Root101]KQZ89629.1 hypothetical protein ASD62_10245 [Phycicoccus sp. Root563]